MLRRLRLRFWLRVMDALAWLRGYGIPTSSAYLFAVGKASNCVDWGSP